MVVKQEDLKMSSWIELSLSVFGSLAILGLVKNGLSIAVDRLIQSGGQSKS
ncbi:MAG: hypothetical protein K2Z81_27735 [Cyanobacteria bacterium]|nr:hypothetical protein [Cyanobacteriota bacterium]